MRRCLWPLIVVALLTGCSRTPSTDVRGDVLTVYSASPLSGPMAAVGRQTMTGEKLALGIHRGVAAGLFVRFVALDSAHNSPSGFNATTVTNNAQTVLDDSSAVAYLGDVAPRATSRALPLLSAASIAVLSPSDPDPQLTAPSRDVSSSFLRPRRTGWSLARLSDAQIAKLAGPSFVPSYRRTFGGTPTAATARGFVAMSLLLAAIRHAGPHADDRVGVDRALAPVIRRALATQA